MVEFSVPVKALIKVGYACNERCTFCHTENYRELDDTAERIDAKIDRAKKLGYSMVVLSGGEPTLRPELFRWAERIAARGMDFGLVTNGLILAYPDVVERLLASRLRYVYMSLHGGTAKVHRSLVRADTFEAACRAVGNLHGKIAHLTINCVITTANVDKLLGVVDLLIGYPELTIKFSMTQPKGGGEKRFDVIVPDIEHCARRVHEAIAYGLEKRGDAPGPAFAHDGLPFCLLPGQEHLYDDLKTNDYAVMIEADEDDFFPVDDVAKVQPEKCEACSLRGACPGLYRGYFEAYGDAMLHPVTGKPRSNSYHFVPTRDVPRPPGAPCPVKLDGTTPYDRHRSLFVRLRDRMRLFETTTRDFADVELARVKDDLGQIYADVSNKLAPDDFARDLKKLVLAAECRTCEARPACTGCWTPVADDVFTRDDRAVHDVLRGLEGRVLDVGCGEGPYLDTLAEAARAGRVRYTGIEPDAGRARVLASRHPWASFEVARAEDAPLSPVDHVLVLRSYNHLADPEAAIDRAIAALVPGGTLTIVDNVAFGLVRSRELAARAERGPGEFEHYRNDDAEAAARRLAGRPVRLLERRDVGPATSNQWMLRYERTDGPLPDARPSP